MTKPFQWLYPNILFCTHTVRGMHNVCLTTKLALPAYCLPRQDIGECCNELRSIWAWHHYKYSWQPVLWVEWQQTQHCGTWAARKSIINYRNITLGAAMAMLMGENNLSGSILRRDDLESSRCSNEEPFFLIHCSTLQQRDIKVSLV